MASGDRGDLLLEYSPPRAHPIVYAGILCFATVLATGSLENVLRDNRPELYGLYALPLLVTLVILAALWPTTTRIFEQGIAPSRPMLLVWRHPFVRWDDLAAVYPSSYDVTGAFVSPFASSDGKVTQTGLGLEWPNGRTETVKFTPTRFAQTSRRSRGYREAYSVVVDLYARRGRPLVPASAVYSQAERDAMLAKAREPFLPFFAIVFLFASAAPVAWVLLKIGVPVGVALPLALIAPLATSLRSWTKSRQRNRILDQLSKAAQFERQREPTGHGSHGDHGTESSVESVKSVAPSAGGVGGDA
ncbi:MAG: hypothetical protein QOJ26_1760 [Thermoplasmata archaeon]|jgi:hypothetical protein|nr:hypothetical protein [Thermoplasmata archaeon]MEA3166886.1 hypothetical protein [Thermoplasmata archaeon]